MTAALGWSFTRTSLCLSTSKQGLSGQFVSNVLLELVLERKVMARKYTVKSLMVAPKIKMNGDVKFWKRLPDHHSLSSQGVTGNLQGIDQAIVFSGSKRTVPWAGAATWC